MILSCSPTECFFFNVGTVGICKDAYQFKFTWLSQWSIFIRLTLISLSARLWTPWHEGEPSAARMSWTAALQEHLKQLKGVRSHQASLHSSPSPASAPGTVASPNESESPSRAWASELRPTCWGWVEMKSRVARALVRIPAFNVSSVFACFLAIPLNKMTVNASIYCFYHY